MDVFIKEKSVTAKVAAMVLQEKRMAVTIGNTIYLWKAIKQDFLRNENWVKHELAHVRQYKSYGKVFFIILYLCESIKSGYINNKFEIEARQAEISANTITEVNFISRATIQ